MKITFKNITTLSIGPSHLSLIEHLLQKGVLIRLIDHTNILMLSQNKITHLFAHGYTSLVPHNIGLVISNKSFVRKLLQHKKIDTTEGKTFSPNEKNTMIAYAEEVGFPVFLRQENSQLAIPSIANIQSFNELKNAINGLAQYAQSLIVEKHLFGTTLRVFYTENQEICVLRSAASLFTHGKILNASEHEWDDDTLRYQSKLLPLAKKMLSCFSPMPYIVFEVVETKDSKQLSKYTVTEVYHSAAMFYPYTAIKNDQKTQIKDCIYSLLFE